MKQFSNANSPFDNFFEQATQITKAHAYDIVCEQNRQLEIKNKLLADRVKYLENLIKEYTDKIISG